ncbi:PAAR-like domain-containing protein [Pseudomonas aeruginosa]
MAHHVYANDNEIASKSAAGKSSAAFPDTCFSPPTPPAGGVPIPYLNTCFARDISNGSRTVFIAGMEIALQHKSYFRTSTGDEPSTPGLKKGINSGRIKGKCYFVSWSPNVKVEGLCVTRHLDWVTHNHSNPANTPPNQYISERMPGDACKKDIDRIKKKCKTQSEEEAKKRKPSNKRKGNLGRRLDDLVSLPDEAGRKASVYHRNKDNAWMDEHCDGLWVKPMKNLDDFKEAQQQIEDVLNNLPTDTVSLGKMVFGELIDLAYEKLGAWFVIKKVGGLATRSALKAIVGGAAGTTGVGLLITGAMVVSGVADFIDTATEIAEALGPEGQVILEDLMNLEKLQEKIKGMVDAYRKEPDKFLADLMELQARRNPCIKARKCMLVPYNSSKKRNVSKGEGCCPGQTGHHVIPDAAMKGNSCYSGEGKAPTICLEGTNQHQGSHGKAHDALKKIFTRNNISTGDKISYEDMRDHSVEAIQKAGAGNCSEKCLKNQLDEYYKSCRGKDVSANPGETKKPSGQSSDGSIGME